jgi:hypothetical protein
MCLARAGCRQLRLSYPKTEEAEDAVLALCAPKRGWVESSKTLLYSCESANIEEFVSSLKRYGDRMYSKSPLQCITYEDLTDDQIRQAVRHLNPPSWAWPPKPHQKTEGIGILDGQISQGLLMNNTLVGWCICHRITDKAHRITNAYVGTCYQHKGWMLLPILRSLEVLKEKINSADKKPEHNIRFGIQRENKQMIDFAEKRIKPFSKNTTETVELTKELQDYTVLIGRQRKPKEQKTKK